MEATHYIHIDKKVLKREVFLFEFTLLPSKDVRLLPAVKSYIANNNLHLIHSGKQSKAIQTVIEKYSPTITLAPNLFLLHRLENERLFLNTIEEQTTMLRIESYTLICINKGHLASSWLKQI